MTRARAELSRNITETIFNWDPYNGADYNELQQQAARDLKTLTGCYLIIDGLCRMLNDAVNG